MKRPLVVLAMAAVTACRASGAVEPTDRYAFTAHLGGELADAEKLAEQGIERTRARPDSVASWTFRLLRAESLVLQQKIGDARSVLAGSVLPGPEFESLR